MSSCATAAPVLLVKLAPIVGTSEPDRRPPRARSAKADDVPKLYVSPALLDPVPAPYVLPAFVPDSEKSHPAGIDVFVEPRVPRESKCSSYVAFRAASETEPAALVIRGEAESQPVASRVARAT